MWRRACPLMIGALVVALVLMRRRRSEADAELDHAGAAGAGATAAFSPEPRCTGDGASTGASDMSAEWEQAVAPMDS